LLTPCRSFAYVATILAFVSCRRKFNYLIDKTKPHTMYRWIFLAVELLIYSIRVYFAEGWYIVTYALGIYILNLFIGFLTPQSLESQEEEADGLKLPTRDDDEYRPFTRRVPEFVFWFVGICKTAHWAALRVECR